MVLYDVNQREVTNPLLCIVIRPVSILTTPYLLPTKSQLVPFSLVLYLNYSQFSPVLHAFLFGTCRVHDVTIVYVYYLKSLK